MDRQSSTPTDTVIIEDTVPVKRRLGLCSGVSFIVGGIIGSGIFISPRGVLLGTGSVGLCLLVWTMCGVISICGALVYAELGVLIPKSGAHYGYLMKAFGNFPAFWYVWIDSLVIMPSSGLIKSLTVAEYVSRAVIDDCGRTEATKRIIAAIIIITVAVINFISVRCAARTQILFTVIKVGGLCVIIVGGVIQLAQGNTGSLSTGFDGTTLNIPDIATAFYSGLWAFDGWAGLNYMTEELKRPSRNLPLSIVISILLVLVVYLLVNISYFVVLDKDEFMSSWAVGVTWAEKVLGKGVIFIPIIVACSVFGSSNGTIFKSARLIFAAARDGNFPEIFAYLHVRSSIPTPPILLTSGLSLVYLALPGDVGTIISFTGFITWGFYGLGMIAHLILRFKMKDYPRPIKVPIIIPIFVLLCCLYLVVAPLLNGVKQENIFAFVYLAAGILLYFPFIYFRLSIPGMRYVEAFLQLFMEVAPPAIYRDEKSTE